jgi:filamentous hemagglutinin family protein
MFIIPQHRRATGLTLGASQTVLFLLSPSLSPAALAQISSDGTLSTNVTTSDNRHFTIHNGSRAGNNLFHSFGEFSVPTNGSAIFNNATDITNIFSRVTGGSISNIDGLIKANGNANLFLLNPNGIIFGSNARLNIGGSFIGTTASSIRFADGVEFSATNPSTSPLLTVSVPIGLQLGANPAPIQVNGTGHNLTRPNPLAPLVRNNPHSGLRVNPGKTLALIGGDITLKGGILTAEGGNVEIGAVSGASTSLGMTETDAGWTLNYDSVQQFADVELTQRALVDAGNTAPGSIRVRGSNLSLQGASLLLLENRGTQPTGSIDIQTTQSVQFTGDSFSNGIISDALSTGRGGDVSISTERLLLQGGGNVIRAWTFGAADGGHIGIDAPEISLIGGLKDVLVVGIRTFGSGDGGNLTLNTDRLLLWNGGSIVNNVNGGSGSAGNLTVNATESVEMGGSGGITSSLMASSAVSPSGSAGSVTVNAPRLVVSDGAFISSSTYGAGTGGSVTVNASESIEVRGTGLNGTTQRIEPSTIRSAGILTPPATQQRLGLPATVTGPAGNITLNTPQLQVTDGATVTVRHDSLGNAGTLDINASEVLLDTGGSLTASTQSGQGGNLNLQVGDRLILRHGSRINVESFGTGNGGNITIASPIIIGLENSDIIANAVHGAGGNIQINTQGIFGLENRPQLTPESDITASSQFGVSGTVAINNPDVDPGGSLAQLPEDVTDPSQQIATGCSTLQESQFVVTGRGGLPPNPTERLNSTRTWSDVRDLSAFRSSETVAADRADAGTDESSPRLRTVVAEPEPANPPAIVEATGWMVNETGNVELVAAVPNGGAPTNAMNCAGTVR